MTNSDHLVARILRQIKMRAPNNTAQPQLAMSLERNEWFVFLEIREPALREYTAETHAPDLNIALAKMYDVVCHLDTDRRQFGASDTRMGITNGYALPAGA